MNDVRALTVEWHLLHKTVCESIVLAACRGSKGVPVCSSHASLRCFEGSYPDKSPTSTSSLTNTINRIPDKLKTHSRWHEAAFRQVPSEFVELISARSLLHTSWTKIIDGQGTTGNQTHPGFNIYVCQTINTSTGGSSVFIQVATGVSWTTATQRWNL